MTLEIVKYFEKLIRIASGQQTDADVDLAPPHEFAALALLSLQDVMEDVSFV